MADFLSGTFAQRVIARNTIKQCHVFPSAFLVLVLVT